MPLKRLSWSVSFLAARPKRNSFPISSFAQRSSANWRFWGEALKRLRRDDADTAARVPGLERIVGLRNVLAHEYGDINYEILWLATTTEIPGLITILNEPVDEARDATGL
ncbi:DUF86 domain-containing protein [Brevibacterium sp. CT2-23B]|uniref:HepT-like ribonuclease domain-containing protein n=1 Tax=Brevibacterium sp. CT2-23B TaxID=2729630 RepID=UPI003463F837